MGWVVRLVGALVLLCAACSGDDGGGAGEPLEQAPGEEAPVDEPDAPPDPGDTATAEEYVAAISAAVLTSDDAPEMDEAQARCVGDAVVAELGIDWLRRLGDPEAAAEVFVGDEFGLDAELAAAFAPVVVACLPQVSEAVATSFVESSGVGLTEAEIACMAAAVEEVTVMILADSLVEEFPSPFEITSELAGQAAGDLVACTPKVAEFSREGLLQGFDLGGVGGAELAPEAADCLLVSISDELMVSAIAAGIRGVGRGGGPRFEPEEAERFASALVACVPELSRTVATSFIGASGSELSGAEIACMSAAAEEVSLIRLADSLVNDYPSPFRISRELAGQTARDLVACTPAVAEFYRAAVLEGIDLAVVAGAEPSPAVTDCIVALVEGELMVSVIAAGIQSGGERVPSFLEWIAVEAQACRPTVPISSVDDVVGSYVLEGTNPGEPGPVYGGEVTLVAAGDATLDITWFIAGEQYVGSASLSEGALAATFEGPVAGTGVWRLTDFGSLVGEWVGTGVEGTGAEVWTLS